MINRVCLRTNEYLNRDGTSRQVDQIEVHVMDMWLKKDINCERDEYLAGRLAKEEGLTLEDYREGSNAPPPLTPEEQIEFGESFRIFDED